MIKAIKNKTQYNKAVKRIYDLMQKELKVRSDEMNELEVLSILVEKYEEDNFPIEAPDPIEAIEFRMDQLGLVQKDLLPYFKYSSRISEVFGGRRQLTMDMARELHLHLNIPADVLLMKYRRSRIKNRRQSKSRIRRTKIKENMNSNLLAKA